MTITRDYYETLGVPRSADTETIKGAFHQLAHRYHPDVSTEPDAEQRFREIAEAYGVLSDPVRRASYDQQGAARIAGASAEDLWGGIDFTDIFGSRAPSFGTLFERLFGPAATGPQPGDDVQHDLTLSLEEVMTGADPLVTIRRPSPCPRCAGRGRVIDDPCPTCQGTGWATRTETVTIRIRPGIPEGATLRLAGQGMPSPMPGGPTGDAYLNIHTATDPLFRRVGADLWHDLHIQACDAALGVTSAVPLPGGQARIRVPPGTQPGSVLRVPGKGLPRYDEDGRGNLQLTVILDIPRNLSPSQRRLYEQLRDADSPSTVEESRSTAGEPEIARDHQKMAADSGPRGATSTLFIVASVLLLSAGIADLVGGVVWISAPYLFLAGALGFGPHTLAWVMIIVGAAELLGAAAIWAGRRASRGPWTNSDRRPPASGSAHV